MRGLILLITLIPFPFFAFAQDIIQPIQPEDGPGGKTYVHQSVKEYNFAQKPDGYWLYEPADPKPLEAPVIVFVHGYGAYNPMIYGAWIKHLVRQGNTVVFPRYQRNLVSPKPAKFSKNVSQGVRDALTQLEKPEHVNPLLGDLIFVGHSYGGVISADLTANYEKHQLPKIDAAMLCAPGTGPFKGGVLKHYKDIPEDVNLITWISHHDGVVGDKFSQQVFHSAKQVEQRNLIRQYPDNHGKPKVTAGHNECYALDKQFDNGKRNVTTKRALRIGKTNAIDYYGYWKVFDALIQCTRNGDDCDIAFGNTSAQTSLGQWSDGTPIRPLEVTLPEMEEAQQQEVIAVPASGNN